MCKADNKILSGEYNSLDILKFILALLVMIIHSGIDRTFIAPLLRTAVPLFFIVSSYFFFSKCEKLETAKEKTTALVRFVKRNLLLYFFWAAVQFPLRMLIDGNFADLKKVLYALKDVLLGNGFTGSWYMMALVIATVIVFYISKKVPAWLLVCFSALLYIVCCADTNYWHLFGEDSFIINIADFYQRYTGLEISLSFPIGVFWVAIGNFLAKKEISLKNSTLLKIALVSGVFIILEHILIIKNGWAAADDCYFLLPLICPPIFLLVKSLKFSFKTSFRLRELSVIIYVTHGLCGRIVGFVLKKLPVSLFGFDVLKIVFTFLPIIVFGYILLYLKENRKIKLLKYAC